VPYISGPVGTSLGETLAYQRDEGERQSLVDFAMHCRMNGPSDEVFEQIPDAFALGVPSFKLFMAYRKRGIMWEGQPLMRALDTIGRLGGIWNCHAENGDLIDYLEDRHLERGAYRPENYLATRPHPPERFAEIPFGAPGVETILPLLYSEGVAKGRLSLPRLAEVLSGAPAGTFGLAPRKGAIAPGADADLVIIDPAARWRLDERQL